jgi:GTP cyclohydrolase I
VKPSTGPISIRAGIHDALTHDIAAKKPGIEDAQAAVETLLHFIGEDPSRPGLVDTPQRVVRAYQELFSGYTTNPLHFLLQSFEETQGYREPVVVSNIAFHSMCEHHLMPFYGEVHVAYVPHVRVVGLSKIPRVVEALSRRLQMQERLTQQIGDTLEEGLDTPDVGVVIRGSHMCMCTRGIKQQNSLTTTLTLRGAFQHSSAWRDLLFNA